MLFECLTQKELTKLENIGRVRDFKQGDALITEGVAGTSFSIILDGRVEVRKGMRGGQFKALVELGPCDLIGELGFFGAESRTAGVIALTDGKSLEFEKQAFEALVESQPAIGAKVYRGMAEILAQRLTTSDESLMDTIIWALGHTLNRAPTLQINIEHRPKLTLKNR